MAQPISDPLIYEAAPGRNHYGGKAKMLLSLLMGFGFAVLWTSSGDEQSFAGLEPVALMARQPMHMQASRLQPVRASKPVGLLDIVLPITTKKSKVPLGELDIMVPVAQREMMAPEAEVERILQSPVTKREMMAATAAAAAAATHGIARADDAEADQIFASDTTDLAKKAKQTITTNPPDEEAVSALRGSISKYIAKYRREKKYSARPSYSNMYSAVNAIAGHYNSFGASAPIPKKRLERVVQELDASLTFVGRSM